jgi:hypothetical protein
VNYKQIKLLLDNDFFYFDEDYYIYDIEFEYLECQINWKTSQNGLVDWSEEVPKSIKRLKKLEEILNPEISSAKNTLDQHWPKSL